ncbi:aldehyde dehydrogenase family 3 member B2-like isoform X3 [Bolinopsis microptera]|uniref:aldehyde dehydrogenase family 3 member B2-like isoform X3 n=1 Tax=Bolinopsis microptera TaxID=2820187 RepID=UPI00307B0EC9
MSLEEEYQKIQDELQTSFDSGVTLPYEYRIGQLKKCAAMIKAMEKEYLEAVHKDMRKHPMETNGTDLKFTESELGYAMKHLKGWMADQYVKTDLVNKLDYAYQHPEPKGMILVIGTWNYPMQCTLVPLIGAICAGCCAVVKLSEVAPTASAVMKKYFDLFLDPLCYRTLEGGVDTATALLKLRWDHIFFTGSVSVGKIVAKAAAVNLTPVTLELGGKCPVIVDENTNIDTAAKRIIWGKCVNAGQTCIAPDYIYCHKKQMPTLIERMKQHITDMYGEDPEQSDGFARIINQGHYNRLKSLMNDGTVVIGGKTNDETNYISPTILTNTPLDSKVMQDEIFGPILPIMEYEDIQSVFKFFRTREKPLVCYLFSSNAKLVDEVKKKVSAGTLDVNDCLMHMMIPTLPFGGVGHSGIGKYHGKSTFDQFSHHKSVLHKPIGMESVNNLRYPPYDAEWKQNLIYSLAYYKPSM